MRAFPSLFDEHLSVGVEGWLQRDHCWRRMVMAAVLMLCLGLIPARPALAASIVVNSLSDTTPANDGVCTLREAIEAANLNTASGAASGECAAGSNDPTVDVITFSLSGTITLGGALPGIGDGTSDDPGYVTIDGDNDDNGSPDIVLDRNGGGGAGLNIGRSVDGGQAINVTIRGLEIREFGAQGINIVRAETLVIEDSYIHGNGNQGIRIENDSTTGVTIEDCRIGVDASGNASANGTNGIQINDGADNVTIRNNVISGNTGDGLQIAGGGGDGSGHLIENNKIGTNGAGTSCSTNFGNGTIGIAIQGGVANMTIQNNIIGCNGRTQSAGGSNGDGIQWAAASSTNNQIKNNYIGTNASGTNLGNHQNGIDLGNGVNNSLIQGNTIANNGSTATSANNDGIHIDGTTTDNNKITQNSIYDNGGADADGLGIDLNGDGVNANDSGDPDSGSNAKQNFPVITAAAGNDGTGQYDVTFSWDFKSGEGPWTIEFFCNKDGGGEGKTYQASTTILSGTASGSTTFSFTPLTGTCNDATNNRITATATNFAGSTSEFSAAADPTAITLQRLDARIATPLIVIPLLLLALLGLGAGMLFQRRRPASV